MNRFHFAQDWAGFWSGISSAMGPSNMRIVGYFGLALIVWSIFSHAWSNSRGRGKPRSHTGWAIACGVMLAAPGLVMPAILTVLDAILNAAASGASHTHR